MKQVKNQQGYALLVVLLMVVLFLGLSATFMAGSLSNAKQEQTVDASNQAVASAEMGVKYHSADFQREIGIIKNKILIETQDRIKDIMDCFDDGSTLCDEQSELTAMEEDIDTDMKAEYILLIEEKISDLDSRKTDIITPFPGEDAQYKITNASVIKLNSADEDVSLPATADKEITSLQVQLDLAGESRGKVKMLMGLFTVEVPDTFLSNDQSLTLETVPAAPGDITLDKIFKDAPTTKSCATLMAEIASGSTITGTECVMGQEQTAEGFKDFLISEGLDPRDFTIYVENFVESYCRAEGTSGEGCNQKELAGLTVVVKSTDAVIVNGLEIKWNGLSNSSTIIDGLFKIGSLNNTSIHADELNKKTQTIIVRELHVTGDISGDGLQNTNLVILGKDTTTNLPDSIMKFDGIVRIGDYGRICFNMDRVLEADWKALRDKVQFMEMNGTGQIIYYTATADSKKFILPAIVDGDPAKRLTSEERTKLYVHEYNDYAEFLSSCGVTVDNSNDIITEVPVPFILDPGIDVDVQY
ncbi:hypothetical protein [Planomicrobium sp. Y74]|uniref:hypothetical protein n=1 Tax=Planomicrobium sp. Y74 TaxID=2478977 RepID=UPI000EF4BC15|nr:hypothetical protein [Planomicrobium sp. Y74]RLQ91979.1 hypothetical protein D9754_04120 [Planomicrobium sp. Y74]